MEDGRYKIPQENGVLKKRVKRKMEDEIKKIIQEMGNNEEKKKRIEDRKVNMKYNMTWKIWQIKSDRVKRDNDVLKN